MASPVNPPSQGAGKRRGLSPAVQAALWTVSNGRCYAPGCPIPVVLEVRPGVYQKNSQIAHIYGVKPNAARYRHHMNETERDCFDNLIILCLAHHLEIDSNEDLYPPEKLREWKLNHEGTQNAVLKSLLISDPDRLLTALTKIAQPPLDRLAAITKRLEETGAENADTVTELKQIIASISGSGVDIDSLTARSLTHAAEVLGTSAFARSAEQLAMASETLPAVAKQMIAAAAQMDRG